MNWHWKFKQRSPGPQSSSNVQPILGRQKPNSQISPAEQSESVEQFPGGKGKHTPVTHRSVNGQSASVVHPLGTSHTLFTQT
jgi:hypothetical protein